jgi:glycosyltransferase involved in cell wall biosynthesis
LHELAAAGFPVIASNKVGSTAAFLNEGVNGYSFEPHDTNQLKALLKKIAHTPNATLLEMGSKSNELASSITPQLWAKKLSTLINK